jgi:hypothetical protein
MVDSIMTRLPHTAIVARIGSVDAAARVLLTPGTLAFLDSAR